MSSVYCMIARNTLIGAVAMVFCAAQVASAQTPTRTRLNVSPSPSNAGATIRLSAEVDNIYGGDLSGMLEFRDGETVLASRPLSVEAASMSAIAATASDTCAITAGGGVRCWGRNYDGELGDGTTDLRYTPVPVIGLTSGVVAVTMGGSHGCALRATRQVQCWGGNEAGELGDGTTEARLSPVTVADLFGAVAIAAGHRHTCALHSTGRVKCWGQNTYGQLGDGTFNSRLTPVIVKGLVNVVAITAGGFHTCAITATGAAKCWGQNIYGQLGSGAGQWSASPLDVSGLQSGVSAISAGGNHTCALIGGSAKCWGYNNQGQIGDGASGINEVRRTPVDVVGLQNGVVGLAGGPVHTCAIVSPGAVKCWGHNYYGALGDGTQIGRSTPASVVGLKNQAVGLTLGSSRTCVITIDRHATCWGLGSAGELGDGTSDIRFRAGRPSGVSRPRSARATFETNALALGVHTLSATHTGDPQHFSSTGQRSHTVR